MVTRFFITKYFFDESSAFIFRKSFQKTHRE